MDLMSDSNKFMYVCIVLQHAVGDYSRRGNFGGGVGTLVRNMILIYSPDDTNVYGSRGMDWGVREDRVGVGVDSCKMCLCGAFPIRF